MDHHITLRAFPLALQAWILSSSFLMFRFLLPGLVHLIPHLPGEIQILDPFFHPKAERDITLSTFVPQDIRNCHSCSFCAYLTILAFRGFHLLTLPPAAQVTMIQNRCLSQCGVLAS
jgi:hypothetical protein